MDTSVQIQIDPRRQLGPVDDNIYGHFIEHLGRCVYGGIWVGINSPLPNTQGFRNDVIEAVRALAPSIIRWPGGNFASGYHWTDGVGPAWERPTRFDLAWKAVESNEFGTEEFIRFCRLVGAEPYICVNSGSGTAEEAARWVEYCNLSSFTSLVRLRRSVGSSEPHKVKYWGIGNEVYGDWQIGSTDAETYSGRCVEFSKLMRRVDPSIKLVGVGSDDESWNKTVLSRCGQTVDYLSYHKYYNGAEPFYDIMAAPLDLEMKIASLKRLIDTYAPAGREIAIALDEWNLWHPEAIEESGHHQKATLTDGLFVSSVLNVLQRSSQAVKIANFAQLVNVLPLIVTNDDGDIYLNPSYLAYKLYVDHKGGTALQVSSSSDTYHSERYHVDVPYLDCSASYGEGILHVSLVNRHKSIDIGVSIKLKTRPRAEAGLYALEGARVHSANDFERKNEVALTQMPLKTNGSQVEVTVPAHTAAIVDLRL